MTRTMPSLWRNTRGNSFVEMALVLPLLTSVLVGTVDISRAVSAQLQIQQAAQRTVERVQRSAFKFSDVSTYQSDAATAADVLSTAVTVDAWLQCNGTVQTPMDQTHFDGACTSGEVMARYVTVQIQKNFNPMFGTRFFPGANADGTFTLTAQAGVRVE